MWGDNFLDFPEETPVSDFLVIAEGIRLIIGGGQISFLAQSCLTKGAHESVRSQS